jgi:hypothetical protein
MNGDGRNRMPRTSMLSERARRHLNRIAIPFVFALSVVGVSYAQVPIANVAGVTPTAIAAFGGQQVTVVQGADLFAGQTIVTNAQGIVQIVFTDETRMVVGPNSELVIERYLMQSPDTVGEFVANALGGTFRFISGDSPSNAYSIRTPAGTIGVRGTVFDLTVLQQIAMMLYGGGDAFHCPEGAAPGDPACTVLDEFCDALSIAFGAGGWTTTEMPGHMFRNATFPLATAAQLRLLQEYRVRGAPSCLIPPEEEEPEPEPDPCDQTPRTLPPSCLPSDIGFN